MAGRYTAAQSEIIEVMSNCIHTLVADIEEYRQLPEFQEACTRALQKLNEKNIRHGNYDGKHFFFL